MMPEMSIVAHVQLARRTATSDLGIKRFNMNVVSSKRQHFSFILRTYTSQQEARIRA